MTFSFACDECHGAGKVGRSVETKWGDGKIMASFAAPCPKCKATEFALWAAERNIRARKA